LNRGLTATAPLWPDIKTAFAWVHQAAHLLANHDGHTAATVRKAYDDLLAEMAGQQNAAGTLSSAVTHFLKVTASYAPGLFHCYTVPDLPRTNNDLEHYFGSARYLERRATGRKKSSPSLAVRGAVRIVAAVATRLQLFQVDDLCPINLQKWSALRRTLQHRHDARRAQLRFRRDPESYLSTIEERLVKPTLPS
jgi:hypothetical protein